MGLLCIQRTLTYGMQVGVCTGLGAATFNVSYGTLIILGLDRTASVMASGGRALNLAGSESLLQCAGRTILKRRTPVNQSGVAQLQPVMAFGSAVAFNANNPMSPVLIIALLSPVIGVSAPSSGEVATLLIGMFTAAVT